LDWLPGEDQPGRGRAKSWPQGPDSHDGWPKAAGARWIRGGVAGALARWA